MPYLLTYRGYDCMSSPVISTDIQHEKAPAPPLYVSSTFIAFAATALLQRPHLQGPVPAHANGDGDRGGELPWTWRR
jgi:hypothetical protein